MTERLGYRHPADLLEKTTSAELTGWLAYLQVDDEVRAQKLAYAIAKAFNNKAPAKSRQEDEEEVIDTTKPEFAEKFKGFNYVKPQPRRQSRQTSTDIKFG